jgi:site-specific recombinase XerD
VKGFFNFCETQGWIADSPAPKLRNIVVAKGNRTAIFTDQQYSQILKAIPLSTPENVPEITRQAWQRRLVTFTELLRCSGMAPVDAVRSMSSTLFSDTRKWAHRYDALFRLAGITEVKTDHRVRRPHPYTFRDTFAVWYLTHGASLFTVSRMLGHSKTETTERAYLPWVREMQQHHIDDARKAQQTTSQPVNGTCVLGIAGSKVKTVTA